MDAGKDAEIERLKAEQGVQSLEEAALNLDAGDFEVNTENEGKSGEEPVPDEQN